MTNAQKSGNPIVNSLPDYVEQNKIGLIAKAVLGGNSLNYFNLQTNVLGPTKINLLNTEVQFQQGGDCGFNPQGSVTLTQREIYPNILKVNMEFCDKNLLGTWAQYQVKVAAGKETLPFEEMFIGDVIKHVNDKLENMLWTGQGPTSASGSGSQFAGILKVLGQANVATLNYNSGTAYNNILVKTYLGEGLTAQQKKDIQILKAKDDVAIFVGPDFYEAWIQEMIAANMFHIFPADYTGSVKLPGTNVDVIKTNGLLGTNKIVMLSKSNVYVGVDMENSKEVFDFWFSKDDRKFKLDIQFGYGVQVAFPDEVVLANYNVVSE